MNKPMTLTELREREVAAALARPVNPLIVDLVERTLAILAKHGHTQARKQTTGWERVVEDLTTRGASVWRWAARKQS